MAIYNEDGSIEKYTYIDIFIDEETKKVVPPNYWWFNWLELMDYIDPPYWVMKTTWKIHHYIEWIKKPRGLSKNNHIQPFVKTYVLKMSYDKEGFDYDGIGDYTYTDYRYKIFDTEKKALKYLKKNILDCNRMPSKLDTVDEFCKEYGFEFYERKY